MRYSSALIASCIAVVLIDRAPASARPVDGHGPSDASTAADPPGIMQQYCTNIRDAATDARVARQMAALKTVEKQIENRIAELDARQAEFEDWLEKREAFLARARASVVAVYANMRPDAAASQLAIIDAETAASVLANLRPQTAGDILNEMEPRRAAQLVLAIAGPVEKTKAKALK